MSSKKLEIFIILAIALPIIGLFWLLFIDMFKQVF